MASGAARPQHCAGGAAAAARPQLGEQLLCSTIVRVQHELAMPDGVGPVMLLEEAEPRSTWRKWVRRLFKGVVVLTLLLLVAAVVFYPHKSQKLTELLLWVQLRPVTGFMIFLLLYIVCTVAFVPVTLLSVAAGAVFGMWVGAVLVWLGAICGETLAFLIGRFLLRGWVKKAARQHQTWRALEAALKEEGWKVVLLLRMAPILPFALLNYAMGSSAVKFSSFFAASSLGVVPGIAMHVYLGTLVKDISTIHSASSAPERARIVVLVVSLTSCVVALVASTLVARHALLKRLRAIEEAELNHPLLNDGQPPAWHCQAMQAPAAMPPVTISNLCTESGAAQLWPFQLRRTKSLGGEAASGGCLAELESCAVVAATADGCGGAGHTSGAGGQGKGSSGSGSGGVQGGTWHDGGTPGISAPIGCRPASQPQFHKGQWWPDLPSAASDPDAEELMLLRSSNQVNPTGGLPEQPDHAQVPAGAGHQWQKQGAAGLSPAGTASSCGSTLLVGSGSWPPGRESLLAHSVTPALPP